MEAKLIYSNFDGLDVSFQGALPRNILRHLEETKEAAKKNRGDYPLLLGDAEYGYLCLMVGESGSRGGYAYRFDTGPDGATWFIANNEDPERWNIRASAHSLALALKGYEGVKTDMLNFLAQLEAIGPQWDEKRQLMLPKERISRIDFCCDFQVEELRPESKHFVAHSRHVKREHQEQLDAEVTAQGNRVQSIRVGEMPNRQVALYNKTKEIVVHGKSYWWDIWGIDPKSFSGEIWRVEPRAGKTELDFWNLKSFADFEAKAGDVMLGILNAIRFTVPTSDQKHSRWPLHPIWQASIEKAESALAPYISKAERKRVLEGLRDERIQMFFTQFRGSLTSLTALMGLDLSELPTTLDAVADDALRALKVHPEAAKQKFNQAEMRYKFFGT
ncbi:conserved hypothetical protein [Rhodospirillaceae bacterium LM-1]|nr:conserved hypothetical protein [Rhodospirillaceae bacterium LM-1]